MSANYYDLLKYAATGQASPSMTYYDRMRASTLMGGAVQTLTGIPPLTFNANGKPLISWSMLGNGQQTGTPTPDAPITPTFCGVRTAQLFEGAFGASIGTTGGIAYNDQYEVYYARVAAGATYIISGGYYVYAYYSDIPSVGTSNSVDNERHFTSQGNTITVIEGTTWIGVRVNKGDKPMINAGSTALPYEPYGWKIPLTCAGQTVPVYLGQAQTVRRIKKLVFDGTEGWLENTIGENTFRARLVLSQANINSTAGYCSHLPFVATGISQDRPLAGCYNSAAFLRFDRNMVNNITEFKSYLAAQYAAGTPVTVWYVLAEPETAIVNEPLCKIGSYADELHSTEAGVTIPTAKGQNTLTVESELQPSEMTITFKG